MMKTLNIDIETYSSEHLLKSGVYRYCESKDFEILLFAYSIDGGAVKVVDLAEGEKIPRDILKALTDETVIKWAFNAQFERVCLSRHLGFWLKPGAWRCTMVWAATLGLPLSLEGVGTVLGLEKQKLKEGKSLIKTFCIPNKEKAGSRRTLPHQDYEKWKLFKEYNKRDVETEMAIQGKLKRFPVLEQEWRNYELDQIINDRGIKLDMDFVARAIACEGEFKEKNMKRARELTGLENPNSPLQLKTWLKKQGIEVESLAKESVNKLINNCDEDIKEILQLRKDLSKSSVKKYDAMEKVVCKDNRARGLLQFYGARTGRYAGRLIQVQNLPQNHLQDLEVARSLIKEGNFSAVDFLYDSIPMVLSELIRTAFVPKEGCRFIVADFSAIEARVIAWLAGETWRLKVFEEGKDIYCASANRMYGVPVEKNGVNGHLREKGKIAELALGYGGSVGALKAMGAVDMGIKEEELQGLVSVWRNSNQRITALWWNIDKAVKLVIKERRPMTLYGINIFYESDILFIKLPSGRNLSYIKPRLGENKFGGESVTYEGVSSGKKWEKIESYGPKFVENIVQAIARDILAEAMVRLTKAGFEITIHIHDEVVLEVPKGEGSVEEICSIMTETPKWAEGLSLSAEVYECEFYKKG